PWDESLDNIKALESFQKRSFAVIQFYTEWCPALQPNNPWFDDVVFNKKLPSIWDHGAIPMITWQPACYDPATPSPDTFPADIASGKHDAYLRSFARKLKTFLGSDRRVYIRLAHEMNTAQYPWCPNRNPYATPETYKQMWRRVRAAFASEGVTNPAQVQWVWCPNNFEAGGERGKAELMYPGDEYVDWTCLDVYQGGDLWGLGWAPTASTIMTPMLDRLTRLAPSKPIAIGEFGVHLQQPQGLSGKAAFYRDIVSRATSDPRIKMAVLFNKDTFAVKNWGQPDLAEWPGIVASGELVSGDRGNARRASDALFMGRG
ncbi:hypothetical protein HDU96_001390, partial [Phlyctochytrium bullatum]